MTDRCPGLPGKPCGHPLHYKPSAERDRREGKVWDSWSRCDEGCQHDTSRGVRTLVGAGFKQPVIEARGRHPVEVKRYRYLTAPTDLSQATVTTLMCAVCASEALRIAGEGAA